MSVVAGGGANLRDLRRHNRALLLAEIRRTGGLSRIELATRSGLSQQAVSKIVPELMAAGLLEEHRATAGGVGKPRTRLTIRPTARYAVGLQMDRDEVRGVRTDLIGTIAAHAAVSLQPGFDPPTAVAAITRCVTTLCADVDRTAVLGVGMGVFGPLDHRRGVIHAATGLPHWQEVPLRAHLTDALGLPVVLDKDTNAAAHAYLWRAENTAAATAVVLIGTGLGVGLLIDGAVYRGPHTHAGEFGHTTLAHDGPPCRCGRHGCLEVLHHSATNQQEAARLLGIGLANLVQLLDLERIVLAGRAVLAAPELYRRQTRAQLATLPPAPHRPRVHVDIDHLGPDLVALGAATELLHTFYTDPR